MGHLVSEVAGIAFTPTSKRLGKCFCASYIALPGFQVKFMYISLSTNQQSAAVRQDIDVHVQAGTEQAEHQSIPYKKSMLCFNKNNVALKANVQLA